MDEEPSNPERMAGMAPVCPPLPGADEPSKDDDGKKPGQTTILELLNRLRWDPSPAYDLADHSMGYWDRIAREIIEAPLAAIDWEASDKFALRLIEEEDADTDTDDEGRSRGGDPGTGGGDGSDSGGSGSRGRGWRPIGGGPRGGGRQIGSGGGDRRRRRTVPLHRIRRVWRGEEVVWSRTGPEGDLK